MKKAVVATMVIAGLVACSYAEQGQKKSYIGLGYQGGTLEPDGGSQEYLMHGLYLSFGSRPIEWLGFEGKVGVMRGEHEDTGTATYQGMTVSYTDETFVTGANVDFVIKPMYTYEGFAVYGKAGVSVIFYQVDNEWLWGAQGRSGSVPGEETTDTDFGFILGGGVSYNFGTVGLNADINMYQYGDFSITPLYSIGATINF